MRQIAVLVVIITILGGLNPALAALQADVEGLRADVEGNLMAAREILHRGDLEARAFGEAIGLGTTRVVAQLRQLESDLATAERHWENLKAAGSSNANRIFKNQLRKLKMQSGRLLSVTGSATKVDLAAARLRADLQKRADLTPPEFTGGIAGTITEQGSGTPLSSIQVVGFDDNDEYIGEAQTDGAGYYEISDLADGTYYLKTYNYSGYIDELYDNIECAGGGGWGLCDHLAGTPIVVSGGLTTTGIDFQLQPGGTISGTVLDESGPTGIYDLRVDIFNPDGDWMSFGMTDTDGVYFGYQGLPTGTYYAMTDAGYTGLHYLDEIYDDIACDPPSFTCDPTTGEPIAVMVGQETSGVDFGLTLGGWITGTLTDHTTGLPIEEAAVDIYNASGELVEDGHADSTGRYVTDGGLPPGSYYAVTYNWDGYLDELYDDIDCSLGCDPTTGTPIVVTLGGATSGIDFALVQGGSITGTVTDESTGLPIQDLGIYIYDNAGEHVTVGWPDSDGNYQVSSGLPAGTYFAISDNWSGYIDEIFNDITCNPPIWDCDPTTGDPIVVIAGGETSGIDFALVKGGTISGAITDQVTGLPIFDAGVDIYYETGEYATYGYAEPDGSYLTAKGLPAGTYYAWAFNWAGYIDEIYDDIPCNPPGWDCDPTLGDAIPVTLGADTSGIDFALTLGGSISGSITDQATGLPIVDATVDIYYDTGDWAGWEWVELDGSYIASGLPAGTYHVVTYNWAGYLDELYDDIDCSLGCDVTAGTPIVVSQGADTSGIDFALLAGGVISGLFTDQTSGLPITDVGIDIYGVSGAWITWISAEMDGTYRTMGLPSGTYYLQTYNWAGYIDEIYDDIPCNPPGWDCDPITGNGVIVTVGSETTGIDFVLTPGGRISGMVTDEVSGLPIDGLWVDVFYDDGSYATSGYTMNGGVYSTDAGLPAGIYYALTYNGLGYLDELYDDIDCSSGCDVTSGTPIPVTLGNETTGITFSLLPERVFTCDFESGDTSDWSVTVP